jgi:hypothetical protein
MLNYLEPVFCEEIEKELEEGKLYISEKYKIAIHLCACGCKQKSVTPINKPNEWTLTKNENKVSLSPSIGNFSWEAPNYHAHYVITDNKIEWC